MTELEKEFTKELLDKCEIAKHEYGYNPTRFIQMIAQYSGVKTAKELIHKKGISDGFTKLQMFNRLELTMEASVTKKSMWSYLLMTKSMHVSHFCTIADTTNEEWKNDRGNGSPGLG